MLCFVLFCCVVVVVSFPWSCSFAMFFVVVYVVLIFLYLRLFAFWLVMLCYVRKKE